MLFIRPQIGSFEVLRCPPTIMSLYFCLGLALALRGLYKRKRYIPLLYLYSIYVNECMSNINICHGQCIHYKTELYMALVPLHSDPCMHGGYTMTELVWIIDLSDRRVPIPAYDIPVYLDSQTGIVSLAFRNVFVQGHCFVHYQCSILSSKKRSNYHIYH